jgi:hypothetical protein
MATSKFYLKNDLTHHFLSTENAWVSSIGHEKTASWDSEAAALAATPAGVGCYVLKVVREEKPVKPPVKGSGPSSK